jgi:hypothetical protein
MPSPPIVNVPIDVPIAPDVPPILRNGPRRVPISRPRPKYDQTFADTKEDENRRFQQEILDAQRRIRTSFDPWAIEELKQKIQERSQLINLNQQDVDRSREQQNASDRIKQLQGMIETEPNNRLRDLLISEAKTERARIDQLVAESEEAKQYLAKQQQLHALQQLRAAATQRLNLGDQTAQSIQAMIDSREQAEIKQGKPSFRDTPDLGQVIGRIEGLTSGEIKNLLNEGKSVREILSKAVSDNKALQKHKDALLIGNRADREGAIALDVLKRKILDVLDSDAKMTQQELAGAKDVLGEQFNQYFDPSVGFKFQEAIVPLNEALAGNVSKLPVSLQQKLRDAEAKKIKEANIPLIRDLRKTELGTNVDVFEPKFDPDDRAWKFCSPWPNCLGLPEVREHENFQKWLDVRRDSAGDFKEALEQEPEFRLEGLSDLLKITPEQAAPLLEEASLENVEYELEPDEVAPVIEQKSGPPPLSEQKVAVAPPPRQPRPKPQKEATMADVFAEIRAKRKPENKAHVVPWSSFGASYGSSVPSRVANHKRKARDLSMYMNDRPTKRSRMSNTYSMPRTFLTNDDMF